MTRVAVIGAGSWGTAVSWLLGGKGLDVRLWAREAEVAEGIRERSFNPLYLTELELPPTVHASDDLEFVAAGAEAVVMVTPSHGVRETSALLAPLIHVDVPVVNLSKGLEEGTHLRMTEVLAETLGAPGRLAALSGPNHAEEVSRGVPSATVVAANDERVGRLLQDLFITPAFRVYTNPDIVGVELAGACKNVVAVGAGMSDGLGYGDNTKATLMTRGLAEMSRLGKKMGANPLTFMGLAGMGDLIATCTSRHSRNRALGEWVATGGTVEGYAETTHMVAEGARSAIAVGELGSFVGIELPITAAVRSVLYEGASPKSAGAALMGRDATDEFHGVGLLVDDE